MNLQDTDKSRTIICENSKQSITGFALPKFFREQHQKTQAFLWNSCRKIVTALILFINSDADLFERKQRS